VALKLCPAAIAGQAFPIEDELRQLRDVAADQVLGPSARAIVQAARARDIPAGKATSDGERFGLMAASWALGGNHLSDRAGA
jgi:hypothetical protein